MPFMNFLHSSIPYAILLLACLLFPVEMASTAASSPGQIRESVIAGTWYPGNPDLLRGRITQFLRQAAIKPGSGKLVALIAPHAGYRYSGMVAAHAYKHIETRTFDTVIIVAPSHHVRFSGVSVYDRGAYRTPLGTVELDTDLIEVLKNSDPSIRHVPEAHQREHSLEIQLPFIQVLMPEAKLVPLVMGDQSPSACQRLARSLAGLVQKKSILLIASTDLSHYHSYRDAKILDNRILSHVNKMNIDGLGADLAVGACEACGAGPMLSVLMAARLLGADSCEVSKALNSGDVGGDRSRVVGYMAAACWRQDSPPGKSSAGEPSRRHAGRLTPEEKALLHRIARQSVEACLNNRQASLPKNLPARLQAPGGAFVTLRKNNQLRGCIGHVVARRPLAETVLTMSQAAATEDPRFRPVRRDEFPELEFEISVLTPLRLISDVNLIQVGTHGIYVRQGNRSGLLLPQVASEYGWDRLTFLEQTCRKAQLAADAWKDPTTQIFIFSAEVF